MFKNCTKIAILPWSRIPIIPMFRSKTAKVTIVNNNIRYSIFSSETKIPGFEKKTMRDLICKTKVPIWIKRMRLSTKKDQITRIKTRLHAIQFAIWFAIGTISSVENKTISWMQSMNTKHVISHSLTWSARRLSNRFWSIKVMMCDKTSYSFFLLQICFFPQNLALCFAVFSQSLSFIPHDSLSPSTWWIVKSQPMRSSWVARFDLLSASCFFWT